MSGILERGFRITIITFQFLCLLLHLQKRRTYIAPFETFELDQVSQEHLIPGADIDKHCLDDARKLSLIAS